MGRAIKLPKTIGEAARQLGVHPETLRRWEAKGKITPQRDGTGRRVYTDEQLRRLQRDS